MKCIRAVYILLRTIMHRCVQVHEHTLKHAELIHGDKIWWHCDDKLVFCGSKYV